MRKSVVALVLVCVLLLIPTTALGQNYLFSLDKLDVHVFIDEDGTYAIDYILVFTNNPSASPIDYVDLGLPNSNFDINRIQAEVNGQPINFISKGDYQGTGTGVALGLEGNAIQPGQTGEVHVLVEGVRGVLYPDDMNEDYASALFAPVYFGSQFIQGNTDMSVTFHLPPGVQPEEPRWHSSPPGFPDEPQTGVDGNGLITYTWTNPNAFGYEQYEFGASFPKEYIPEETIVTSQSSSLGLFSLLGVGIEALFSNAICCGFIFLVAGGIFASFRRSRQRKLAWRLVNILPWQ